MNEPLKPERDCDPVRDPADPSRFAESPTAESPCIGVCEVDQNEICVGCYRTLDEIASYGMSSNLRRQEINEAAKRRGISLQKRKA